MARIADMLGTLRSSWRIGRATLDTSGLTAARALLLPDAAGTLALAGDRIERAMSADITTTSSSLQDTGLSFSVGPNEVWNVCWLLFGQVSTVNGMRLAIGGPSGMTLLAVTSANTSGTTWNSGNQLTALDTTNGTFWTNAGTDCSAQVTGSIKSGATGGTVTLKVRAVTAGDTLTVRALSKLSAAKAALI